MNITILSHGYGLMEILTEELSKIGLLATQVDYKNHYCHKSQKPRS